MAEGIKALRAVERAIPELQFLCDEFSVGAGEYLKSGDPLPNETFAKCKEYDAILLGAMGLPGIRWPDGKEMTPQIDLRERLDLYCGLRPIKTYHPNDTPVRVPKACSPQGTAARTWQAARRPIRCGLPGTPPFACFTPRFNWPGSGVRR
jgi:isocitrate/isopropylmalate dehydrogenase